MAQSSQLDRLARGVTSFVLLVTLVGTPNTTSAAQPVARHEIARPPLQLLTDTPSATDAGPITATVTDTPTATPSPTETQTSIPAPTETPPVTANPSASPTASPTNTATVTSSSTPSPSASLTTTVTTPPTVTPIRTKPPVSVERHASVMFVENVGQLPVPDDVPSELAPRFIVRGQGSDVFLAPNAIWRTLLQPITGTVAVGTPVAPAAIEPAVQATPPPPDRRAPGRVNVRFSLVGASPNATLIGFDPLSAHISYFLGNDSAQWRPDVPVWAGVRYIDVYPGIDLEVTSLGDQWVWQLVLKTTAHAPLQNVSLRVEGAGQLTLVTARGAPALRIDTPVGNLDMPLLQVVDAQGRVLSEADLRAKGVTGDPAVNADQVLVPFAAGGR